MLANSDIDQVQFTVLAVSCVILFGLFYPWPGRKLVHVPAVGYQSHLLSFIGGFQFLFKAQELLQRGLDQYGEGVFKVPNLVAWKVIVHGEKYIEDLRKAPESVLSFHDSVEYQLQIPFTLGPTIGSNPYHIPIIRTLLTRNIPTFFPALCEEVMAGFNARVPVNNREWIKVKVLPMIMPIVSRASNFVFVGSPLCRDGEYLHLSVMYTQRVIIAAAVLQLLPLFLRPLASRLFRFECMIDECVEYLQPLIDRRRQSMTEHGRDDPGKPNDLLSWIMDEATGEEASTRSLIRRILTVNMAAIHTSSMAFTHVLFDLATHLDCIQELRDEVGPIIHREGWTHEALNQMIKVDSFIKESQRLNAMASILMERVVRRPFTFHDGTFLPVGAKVSAAVYAAHLNGAHYTDPHTFHPFRFVEMREKSTRKLDMASTHSDFLAFGHGLHACPGRFFAANELKLMLAYVVKTYDVKMEGDKSRPRNKWYMTTCVPDPDGEVLFRKRMG